MEIICLTENIDSRDLNTFEEVFREEYNDDYEVVLLENVDGLLKKLKESTKKNDEILIIAEDDLSRVKKVASYFSEECDISIFNTKNRMFENNAPVAGTQVNVATSQAQGAQTQQQTQVTNQTAANTSQNVSQNIVLVETVFNLATKGSNVNAESIKAYLKNYGHQKNVAIRWIHNPVMKNIQKLSKGAESKIAQIFYGLNISSICDVLDTSESIISPSENIIEIVCTDSCYNKVRQIIGKDIKRPMVLKELDFDTMKKMTAIVQEVENDFKNRKVLMKVDDKDEQGKLAIVEECTNQNILTYFKMISDSLKVERIYSKTVDEANKQFNAEKKNIDDILKSIDSVLGISYELQGLMNILNDPENPFSGLIAAAKTVYDKAKNKLSNDKKKNLEKVKKKIEDVNNKSLSDIVAYFKIHSKWKEFSELIDV